MKRLKVLGFVAACATATAVWAVGGAPIVSAPGVKSLVTDALRDGQAEGVVDQSIAGVFQSATGSSAPVRMKIRKVKDYDNGCGQLVFEMIQDGVKDANGKLVTVNPQFTISICPDGQPPKELVEQEQNRRTLALSKCHVKIDKGARDRDSGATRAFMRLSGCPQNGKARVFYTGTCQAITTPTDIYVEYPLNEKGAADMQMALPAQCTSWNVRNTWRVDVIERGTAMIGNVTTSW